MWKKGSLQSRDRLDSLQELYNTQPRVSSHEDVETVMVSFQTTLPNTLSSNTLAPGSCGVLAFDMAKGKQKQIMYDTCTPTASLRLKVDLKWGFKGYFRNNWWAWERLWVLFQDFWKILMEIYCIRYKPNIPLLHPVWTTQSLNLYFENSQELQGVPSVPGDRGRPWARPRTADTRRHTSSSLSWRRWTSAPAQLSCRPRSRVEHRGLGPVVNRPLPHPSLGGDPTLGHRTTWKYHKTGHAPPTGCLWKETQRAGGARPEPTIFPWTHYGFTAIQNATRAVSQ